MQSKERWHLARFCTKQRCALCRQWGRSLRTIKVEAFVDEFREGRAFCKTQISDDFLAIGPFFRRRGPRRKANEVQFVSVE